MGAVRYLAVLLTVAATVAMSGGSARSAVHPGAARKATTAKKTARFTLLVDANVRGAAVRSSETGTLSFLSRRAHLYKIVPGGGMPQELIFVGPYTYTNANVQAALNDPSVKPWTKLDNRRLSPKQRASRPDELAHVRALVYLPDGIAKPRRLASMTVAGQKVTHYQGVVSPARALARAPASERAGLAQALRNDYPAKPFLASYWLDAAGRVRRVLVAYRLWGGTPHTPPG